MLANQSAVLALDSWTCGPYLSGMSHTRSKQIRRYAARTYKPAQRRNAARQLRRAYNRGSGPERAAMREQMG